MFVFSLPSNLIIQTCIPPQSSRLKTERVYDLLLDDDNLVSSFEKNEIRGKRIDAMILKKDAREGVCITFLKRLRAT